MRASEFITEGGPVAKPHPDHIATMTNVSTFWGLNMYHGSGYELSKMVKALAGAGAGNTPSENMGEENFIGGDPLFSPYHPIEEEMIDNAAKSIGDKTKRQWTGKRSQEPESVHRHSPVKGFKGY